MLPQPAGLIRRSLAAITDFCLVLFSFFIVLSYAITPLYNGLFAVDDIVDQYDAIQLQSNLFYEDEFGVVRGYSTAADSTDDLAQPTYDYYALFKEGKTYLEGESPFAFSIAWFNETILLVEEETSLFELVAGDVNALAVAKTSSTPEALKTFYIAAYQAAVSDLLEYPSLLTLLYQITNYYLQMYVISFAIPILFYYLIAPFILGDGQTIGKRFSRIAVADQKTGLKVKPLQVFLRFLGVSIAYFLFLFLMVFDATLSLMVVLVLYSLMAFTKHNRTAHDFIGSTYVVDVRSTAIFRTAEERTAFEDKIAATQAITNDVK